MKTRDALKISELFGGLPDRDLEEIEKIAVEKEYEKGKIIFYDGDEGKGFYLVASGTVSVYKLSPEGKEQILHLVKEGGIVGAVPVFSGTSFPANARALAVSRLLFFDRDKFLRLISQKPLTAMNILALLSARLREFTVQIENLSLKEIPSRLASYLLYLSEEQGMRDAVRLNLPKLQLANLLGTGPESLSRALSSMKQKGLISEEGKYIKILDRTLLKEMAVKGKF
jgi:CRP/FNR family transcriptional regulator